MVQEIMQAADGNKTVIHFLNSIDVENNSEFVIKYMANPDANLSNRLQAPNTNAPFFPLVPTTSEIKLIPVESTSACDIPINTATMNIIQ